MIKAMAGKKWQIADPEEELVERSEKKKSGASGEWIEREGDLDRDFRGDIRRGRSREKRNFK